MAAEAAVGDPNLYVGFSMTRSMLGWLIRAFTGGNVNHAFLAWQDANLGWVVLGANDNGLTMDAIANFQKTRTIAGLFRPKNSTLWSGLEALKQNLNVKYNFSGLVGMTGVELARKLLHWNAPNLLDDKERLFCSEFTVDVLRASGYPVLTKQQAATVDPAELMAALIIRTDFERTDVPAQ